MRRSSLPGLAALILAICLAIMARAATPDASQAASAATVASGARAPNGAPNIALYYGKDAPWDELGAFDAVVVEPDNVKLPIPSNGLPRRGPGWIGTHTELLAYLSVGEVHPTRPYFKDVPAAWKAGANTAWGSIVIDQTQPQWPEWFMDKAVRPLMKAGYRGFFLDTLDSFNLVAKTDAERQAQAAGLVRVITAIKKEFPDAKLVFNRGFEVLPQVHGLAYAVAAESLFQGWDAGKNEYREVPAADRDWLLGQLNRVKNEYKVPVLAIDYVAPESRDLARQTARRIMDLGFTPWVTNPALDLLGVGAIEVMPRKIMVVYDGLATEYGITYEESLRFLGMPINYLGYVPEFHEVRQPWPTYPLAGRYAGVVAMFSSEDARAGLGAFVKGALSQNLKVAFLGAFGIRNTTALNEVLGLKAADPAQTPARLSVDLKDASIGFEAQPLPDRRGFFPLAAGAGSKPLLRLKTERGETMDAVAMTPWGGYAIAPYHFAILPANKGVRWVVQPIEFLRQALALSDMPVPDTTTESGRRLMLVHVDGDGFANKAEIPGTPYAGEVLQREFIAKYPVPWTVSVIEGEVGPEGLYKDQSPALEAVAKRIFALPQVEIASHSYSHPFRWSKAEASAEQSSDSAETYTLPIPNYRFNLEREIEGSLKYINSRLAPRGKQVKLFLWTGDCNPDGDAIEEAFDAGVVNMNGGETWITRAEPSLTLVAPLGVKKGDFYQIYAPNQNENVYTNLWTGPYYGFERVIETFEMTERPYRLKPINVYFHMYSATKRASITALHKVFQWALSQRVMNIYASDYAKKAMDFMHLTVSRFTVDGAWRVRGAGELRTLRMSSSAPLPDLGRNTSLAGYRDENNQRYLHMSGDEALVQLRRDGAAANAGAPAMATSVGLPFLAEANARVVSASRAGGVFNLELSAAVPISFSLAEAAGCTVRANGQQVTARQGKSAAGAEQSYELKQDGTAKITVECRR